MSEYCICTAQLVAAFGHGDRTLGIRSQGQTGNFKVRGLFLNATGISNDQAAVHDKIHKFFVAHGVEQMNVFGIRQ